MDAGEVLINYAGGENAKLKFVPGSTELGTFSRPSCDFKARPIPDGLLQGGIVVEDVVGFIPGRPCDGQAHQKFLYFDADVR